MSLIEIVCISYCNNCEKEFISKKNHKYDNLYCSEKCKKDDYKKEREGEKEFSDDEIKEMIEYYDGDDEHDDYYFKYDDELFIPDKYKDYSYEYSEYSLQLLFEKELKIFEEKMKLEKYWEDIYITKNVKIQMLMN